MVQERPETLLRSTALFQYMFRRFVPLVFLFALLVTAAEPGQHAEYLGGTRADIPLHNSGVIQTASETYFVFVSKQTRIKIPYERINLVEYGQKVDRRYLPAVVISPLFLLAKKREHFLTVGFQDDSGKQEALIFRVDKNDIRTALVTLEARTGQEVRYQDEEAKKAGKG